MRGRPPAGLGRDAAERARVEVHDSLRIAPVEMVEEVERLQAELQPLRPGHAEQLRHGQVDVPVVRPDHGVARQVAQRAGRRLRKRRAVEVVRQRARRVEVVADLVGPLVADAGERVVDAAQDVEPVARPRGQDPRQPPVRGDARAARRCPPPASRSPPSASPGVSDPGRNSRRRTPDRPDSDSRRSSG